MFKGALLFVYGTLRLGERADLSKDLNAEYIGEDSINGRIYDLGSFPGFRGVPGAFEPDKDVVRGDVFRLHDDSLCRRLDIYEGYPDLYNRFETQTAGGRTVTVYVFNGDGDGDGVSDDRLIKSGDWKSRVSTIPHTARRI